MSKRPTDGMLPAAKRVVEPEWLNHDIRTLVLRFAAGASSQTNLALMLSGMVTMSDILASTQAPPHINEIICKNIGNCVCRPDGARFLENADIERQFTEEEWSEFMDGTSMQLWKLRRMVSVATRDEARLALQNAQKQRNYLPLWFLFRRLHERNEHIEEMAEVMRHWIWCHIPGWQLLVQAYPMTSTYLWPMAPHMGRSPNLCEALRTHRDFDNVCWAMLVCAVTADEHQRAGDLLDSGVMLRTHTNLVHLAALRGHRATLAVLLANKEVVRLYAPEALTMERQRFMTTLQIARAAWCTIS